MPEYQTSLFIFRRDLRLIDNTALNAALAKSKSVIAAFIFDPQQIQPHPYQSLPALQFMLEAIADLQLAITDLGACLYLFNDDPSNIVKTMKQKQKIEAVFVNRDYTPFSRQRDAVLKTTCQALNIAFHDYADSMLNEPEQLLTDKKTIYQVFTPYFKQAAQRPVAPPCPLYDHHLSNISIAEAKPALLHAYKTEHGNAFLGGRRLALQLLNNLTNKQAYSEERDFPALASTTHLSPYLKFGCCSIREAYYAVVQSLGREHALVRQFYWRDFFTQIAFHYPKVFGHAFHSQYEHIAWQNRQDWFWLWANGNTGFPIIDAAMRELNQTGWMHNRLRMITASFLVKDLQISWRWGERYFAQHLLDYDPCINNGNWQWAASTGCDAQPYFRIFNPWLQQKKFDPDCEYIKRWLPELAAVSSKVIHQGLAHQLISDYPSPMIDHQQQSRLSKALFAEANNFTNSQS